MGSPTPTHYAMETDYSASRLPPSSSALIALSTLTPPSPCLTASLSSTSITSGDIPILLDGLDFSANHRHSTASGFSDWRISASASLHESNFPQSSSCVSTGTFGPICRRQALAYREFESHAKEVKAHEPYTASTVTVPWPQTTLESQGPPERASYLECAYTAMQPASEVDTKSTSVEYVVGSKTPIRKERLSLREGFGAQLASSTTQHDDPYDVFTIASNRPTLATTTKAKFKPVTYFAPAGDKRRSTFSLDNIKTVISIDQEGFRSVNPAFKFVGHSKRTFDDKRQRAETMAQFVPLVNQQTFHFHYAPLDGLPVLRRISVNDDETRDYISREATLGLKSNGIYVVHGTELATQTMHDENRGHGTMELHWEFVYKVEDRKVGPSKKIVDGEKNLTPLSLSCSPALLNPRQGKKVNLLHIVKKSITAKLTAEKLEASESKSLIPARPPLHNTTNSASGRHRRALSYGRQLEHSTCNAKPLAQRGVLQENRSDFDDQDLSRGARRRRASSAGEWDSQPGTKVEADTMTMCPPIQKHIISPARLAQMLETKSVKKNVLPAIPQIDFYPLAPNPRHYRTRARNGVLQE